MQVRDIRLFAGIVVAAFMLAACGQAAAPPTATPPPAADAEHEAMEAEHEHGEDEHGDTHAPEDHMAGAHDVPDEAAAVPNPFEASDESVAKGKELYAASCAVCHGETGEGDGPGASGMEAPPADLHEGHVQGLTDGALFYIISHGRPDTPMPAWENVLSEEERWHVVNFLRTFGEE